MQPDSAGAPDYISGLHGVWVICERCGEKKRRADIAKEWTGSMVCRATCLDPIYPEMMPPNAYPEGLPVPDARPRPPDIFVDPDNPVTPDDL